MHKKHFYNALSSILCITIFLPIKIVFYRYQNVAVFFFKTNLRGLLKSSDSVVLNLFTLPIRKLESNVIKLRKKVPFFIPMQEESPMNRTTFEQSENFFKQRLHRFFKLLKFLKSMLQKLTLTFYFQQVKT
jgi:hypothetical protein